MSVSGRVRYRDRVGSCRDRYIQQSVMESAEVNKVDSRIAKVRKVYLMHGYQYGIGWNLEPWKEG